MKYGVFQGMLVPSREEPKQLSSWKAINGDLH